jgi:integrase
MRDTIDPMGMHVGPYLSGTRAVNFAHDHSYRLPTFAERLPLDHRDDRDQHRDEEVGDLRPRVGAGGHRDRRDHALPDEVREAAPRADEPAVYDALTALEPDPARRQGLLFRKRDARRWGQIRTAFEGAVTKAGLKDFRFHDLGHTAASHMVMRGANLADVKELLGHSDLKMTLRYAHPSPAHLRRAVDRLDGLT